MYKQLAALALGLISATTASAQTQSGAPVFDSNRVVILWGDSNASGWIAAGDPYAVPTTPDVSSLNGSFFGNAGSADGRPMVWTTPSYTQGLSSQPGNAGSTEFGSSIAYVGERKNPLDAVYVINLGLVGTDIATADVPNEYWALDANGDLPAGVATAIDVAVQAMPLDVSRPTVSLDAIVFSCWNNGTASFLAGPNNSQSGAEDDLAVEAAKDMCDAITAKFRASFAAANGAGSTFNLTPTSPQRIAYRRHDVVGQAGWVVGRELQNGDLCDIWADTSSTSFGYGTFIDGQAVLDQQADPTVPFLQVDNVHLSPENARLVGAQFGLAIF